MTTTAHSPSGTPSGAARASGAHVGANATSLALPRVGGGSSGAAPLRSQAALLQVVLMWAGAILMPLGIVVILLGYYGVANSVYDFEREAYQASGGFLGLGLTFLGGFLYFGSWLARIASDNREASRRLADSLLVLADVTSRAASLDSSGQDTGALPVTTAGGTTVHRRDCTLVSHRHDLTPAADRPGLVRCRVCSP
jgi:hypothetical protein